MACRRAHPRSPHRPVGFTLIELIVSLLIIAILMSLLLPLLVHARKVGSISLCAANLRQVGIAWQGYVSENGVFPREPVLPDWRYGGVRFEGEHRMAVIDAARPINAYLEDTGAKETVRLAGLFRCPSDSGLQDEFGIDMLGAASVYEQFGTSYRANPYLVDASASGLDDRPRAVLAREVTVSPSRLLVLGDPVWYYATLPDAHPERRVRASWHLTPGAGNVLVQDGSTRLVDFLGDPNRVTLTPREDLTPLDRDRWQDRTDPPRRRLVE